MKQKLNKAMPLKIPQVIAHRGASAYAPENTLEAIHTAADMGVEWVEFDVRLTKDDVPVLLHDDDLLRTTGTAGRLADTLFDDFRKLDAGSWFGDSFIGVTPPTLEETVDVLLKRGLGANVEITPCPGRDRETAMAVLDELSRIWSDPDRILISSFSITALEVARDMAPEWPRGLLLDIEWPKNWRDLVRELEVSTININGDTVTREDVKELMSLGIPVLAYTINDLAKARELQSWGVYGFFTDEPDTLLGNLIEPVNDPGSHPAPL